MSCFICGRGACMPSFHPREEQEAFEPAEEAYERYLEVRAECERQYRESDEEE